MRRRVMLKWVMKSVKSKREVEEKEMVDWLEWTVVCWERMS